MPSPSSFLSFAPKTDSRSAFLLVTLLSLSARAQTTLSREQVVELAFPGQPYDPEGTTVEYSRGHGHDKSLRPGETVRVKEGMVFNVSETGQS